MRKIFLAVATALAMFSCSQKEPVTVTITNPLSIDRNGEMVEISMAEITGKLQLPDTAQVIVLDEKAGAGRPLGGRHGPEPVRGGMGGSLHRPDARAGARVKHLFFIIRACTRSDLGTGSLFVCGS